MKVLYAGSFNPFHNGHQYVYEEACRLFGKENVIIGLAHNPAKGLEFEKKAEFLKWTMARLPHLAVALDFPKAQFITG